MSMDVLEMIDQGMKSIDINYDFGEWKSEIPLTYWVGEYQEVPTENEMQETSFMLNGFSRGSWLEFEQEKEKIEKYFNKTAILDSGSGVAVFYENGLVIPTGDAELKRIQINLKIKEWKVN